MEYQISLPNFEGPLDLLYHLVKKAEVDIYEISIAEITDQYMEYLNQWEKFNLEIASEFLVMAARLMELKSRELLPKKNLISDNEEDQEIDPKQELLNKIVEYKYFKEIANHLKEQERERFQVYWRDNPDIPDNIDKQEQIKVGDLGLYDLLTAFHKVMNKYQRSQEVTTIDTKEVSITEQREVLLQILSSRYNQTIYFEELFQSFSSRLEIVTAFLALLDLVKERKIIISQQDIASPLWIQLSS